MNNYILFYENIYMHAFREVTFNCELVNFKTAIPFYQLIRFSIKFTKMSMDIGLRVPRLENDLIARANIRYARMKCSLRVIKI